MTNKCFVIGLDGATFDIIRPLISEGKLSNISRLIDKGVHGELKSTIPPASIPAWPSFLTGNNPGKHGVYDFLKRTEGEYIGSLTNSSDFQSPTIYEILSAKGKTSVVMNVTGTYPPKKMNGCIISGLLTPRGANYVYPSVLKETLDSMGYIVYKDFKDDSNPEIMFQELLSMEQKRKHIALYLMKLFDWDFFMIMFIGTDTIQHKLWGEKVLINNYYYEIDKIIGDIIENICDDTNVFIISDHGFGPLKKYVYVNKYFKDLNLLKTKVVDFESTEEYKIGEWQKKKVDQMTKFISKTGLNRRYIKPLINMLRLNKIKEFMPDFIKKRYYRLPRDNLAIDWTRTKVVLSSFYTTETQSVMINLKGREPEGIVEPDNYEELREHVISELKRLKDPEMEETILEDIFRREELYHGPYLQEAPDIVMMLKGNYKPSNSFRSSSIVSPTNRILGSHRINGVFIAMGPDIAKGEYIENAAIFDVAPTILKLMNIPVPEEMDGRILSEIFSSNDG